MARAIHSGARVIVLSLDEIADGCGTDAPITDLYAALSHDCGAGE